MRNPHFSLYFPQNYRPMLIVIILTIWLFSLLPMAHSEPVFPSQDQPEQGWNPLATLLNKLTPDIDTSIPLSGTQINQRIYRLINQGQADEALEAIKRREAQLAEIQPIGTDVQLLFLKARAYEALGASQNALQTYQQMTELYPELPEPWNNLAVVYAQQGKLLMAQEALGMALIADPTNQTALQNLGEIRLMLAEQAFQEAGGSGTQRANELKQLLQ